MTCDVLKELFYVATIEIADNEKDHSEALFTIILDV